MADLHLVVGNKNLSSWSLRAWLALRLAGLPFRETVILLDRPETGPRLQEHSPSGRVPVLRDGETVIWDSLAVCEYAAELAPEAGLWPAGRAARAVARSVCCEMHAGFTALREHLPMRCAEHVQLEVPAAAAADVRRVMALWAQCRRAFGERGPFLFGDVSIADAFYAPVVTRFVTYDVAVTSDARAYMDTVLALAPMREWLEAARAELSA